MKALRYFFSVMLFSAHIIGTVDAQAEEGEIVTGSQAIDDTASEFPTAAHPKGALEPGGEPLGKTAPLNGDRASGPSAQNQSAKPESVKITRSIRQQIIEHRDLSTAAKNVTIVTDDNGAVTLRGPVKTANEKQELEQIARNNAVGGAVNNQIVVKGQGESKGAAHG
jgi:hyperosmotically inducible protein